jgi:agmatine deiminase
MKFDDCFTSVVYVAEYLKQRYPVMFYPAKVNFEANGIELRTIPKTQNIWTRDYMPIQVGDHFVRFQYKTVGYDDWPQMKVTGEEWLDLVPVYESQLILDGGGIIRSQDKAVVTEKVFRDNRDWKTIDIIKELEKLLECQVIIIPSEPGDELGHADGIVKFVDEKTILTNDYSSIFTKDSRFIKYSEKIIKIFQNSGLEVELFPYGYGEWDWNMKEEDFRKEYPEADDFNPGFGYYINFLIVMGLILVPMMGIPMDVQVTRTLRRLYPQFNVVAIDCSHLSMEGGLCNCVTANYMKF